MAKKVGELIKEARTAAKLTQAQLAEQVTVLAAADISKAERGEKELTQAQLKQIAKATGVTQASLLDVVPRKAQHARGRGDRRRGVRPPAVPAKVSPGEGQARQNRDGHWICDK